MQHAELVTLALISARPAHSYELNKQLDSMEVRRWAKLGASTVYKVLQRLASKGLVEEKTEREGNRPPRTVYSITPEGRTELQRLIGEGLASTTPAYSDRLVAGIFAAGTAGGSKGMKATLDRLEGSEERLNAALETPELSPIGRIVIEFQAALIRAERDAITALSKLPQSGKS